MEHAELFAELRPTVATIDGDWEYFNYRNNTTYTQEGFRRETVHRWAHAMETQTAGTVIRYSPIGKGTWKPRKRHVRRFGTNAGDATGDGRTGGDSDSKARRVGPRPEQGRFGI